VIRSVMGDDDRIMKSQSLITCCLVRRARIHDRGTRTRCRNATKCGMQRDCSHRARASLPPSPSLLFPPFVVHCLHLPFLGTMSRFLSLHASLLLHIGLSEPIRDEDRMHGHAQQRTLGSAALQMSRTRLSREGLLNQECS